MKNVFIARSSFTKCILKFYAKIVRKMFQEIDQVKS